MKNEKDILREHLSKLGKKGGRARAKIFSKAQLVEWAKLGGRPSKKGKGKADGD
jgi:hypothetical protein